MKEGSDDESTYDRVHDWLDEFAQCIRTRDYARGRALCDERIVGFGTVTDIVRGLEALEERQWRRVWGDTEGFAFDDRTVEVLGDEDESQYVALARWRSSGIERSGARFDRTGRSTIVLRRTEGAPHGLAAVHTHFSMDPDESG